MSRHPHILNASSSLLGICFVIITGLKLTGANPQSWADEITWIASLLFLASIVVSYLGVRNEGRFEWMAVWAEGQPERQDQTGAAVRPEQTGGDERDDRASCPGPDLGDPGEGGQHQPVPDRREAGVDQPVPDHERARRVHLPRQAREQSGQDQ